MISRSISTVENLTKLTLKYFPLSDRQEKHLFWVALDQHVYTYFQRLVSLLWRTHPSWDALKVESQTSERRDRKGNCNTWMPEGLNRHKGWNANRDAVMPLLWQHSVQREALCSLMLLDSPQHFFDLVKGMCIHDFTGYKISCWTITCFMVIHIMASLRRYISISPKENRLL